MASIRIRRRIGLSGALEISRIVCKGDKEFKSSSLPLIVDILLDGEAR